MRVVAVGTHNFTEVICRDEPGPGGACHEYEVCSVPEGEKMPGAIYAEINFQKGPVKEAGVNGIHNEDLIAIVIDRLEYFQRGPFACRENEMALTRLRNALSALNSRTQERRGRGVEGTNQI
jgi:hypothetical protein